MARRFKQPDPKMAPKNHARAAILTDTHHQAVMATFEERIARYAPEIREKALSDLLSWKNDHPTSYYEMTPRQLFLGVIIAATAAKDNDDQPTGIPARPEDGVPLAS